MQLIKKSVFKILSELRLVLSALELIIANFKDNKTEKTCKNRKKMFKFSSVPAYSFGKRKNHNRLNEVPGPGAYDQYGRNG